MDGLLSIEREQTSIVIPLDLSAAFDDWGTTERR